MENLAKQLKPGDLIALFYRTRAEQRAFAIPYLKAGLEQNQRCLYIAHDTPVALILKKLEETGVDVTSAQKRGALTVLTKHETYLRSGTFDPDRMIADLEAEVQAALKNGFSALRGSGDMSWALDNRELLDRLIEYQVKLYERPPTNFLAVCQFDESRFPPDVIEKMTSVHQAIIRDKKLIWKADAPASLPFSEPPPAAYAQKP